MEPSLKLLAPSPPEMHRFKVKGASGSGGAATEPKQAAALPVGKVFSPMEKMEHFGTQTMDVDGR